jgi:hypothetical protein
MRMHSAALGPNSTSVRLLYRHHPPGTTASTVSSCPPRSRAFRPASPAAPSATSLARSLVAGLTSPGPGSPRVPPAWSVADSPSLLIVSSRNDLATKLCSAVPARAPKPRTKSPACRPNACKSTVALIQGCTPGEWVTLPLQSLDVNDAAIMIIPLSYGQDPRSICTLPLGPRGAQAQCKDHCSPPLDIRT